jgi:4-methyl-5(b-hydroxyethyl)-thiazole monophosphate biosynthesis
MSTTSLSQPSPSPSPPPATTTTMWPTSPLPSNNIRILIPIADGTEEIEFSSLVGVFRRANIHVDTAYCGPTNQHDEHIPHTFNGSYIVKGSRQIFLSADKKIEECVSIDYDAIILPGGTGGAENLRDTPTLISLLRKQKEHGKLYGAICASPAYVLSHYNLLGSQATAHPSVAGKLIGKIDLLQEPNFSNDDATKEIRKGPRVIYDTTHNVITSIGPGSAIEYALNIVCILLGKEMAQKVVDMVLPATSFEFIV